MNSKPKTRRLSTPMASQRRKAILAAYEGHARRFDLIASRRPRTEPQSDLGSRQTTEVETLSDRQIEVLTLVAEGLSNDEISVRLEVTLETVKTHVIHILQRLSARTRAHAVSIGHRDGLLA